MRALRLAWGSGRNFVTSGTGKIVDFQGCIAYLEVYETTGTASAAVTFYDGASANGKVITDYTLSASQSTSEEWGPHWMPIDEGLYVKTTSGSVAGSVTIWDRHDCCAWLEAQHRFYELGQ